MLILTEVARVDSEVREMLTAILEGQQVLTARMTALQVEVTEFKTEMYAFRDETKERFDVLTADVNEIKNQVVEMNLGMRFLTHKTGELEKDVYVLKAKP